MLRHIDYPSIPLTGLLDQSAIKFPDNTAIVYDGIEISYSELAALSKRFAGTLDVLGVRKGDRVALFLPNVPQFIIAFFGVLRVGGVVTAISPLSREREVKFQLNDSGAETIVTLDALFPVVERIRNKNRLRNVIVTGVDEFSLKQKEAISVPETFPFYKSIEKINEKDFDVSIDPNQDLAALQYTGGTTGIPKGAMLTHMNLVSNALMFTSWIKGTLAKETFLTALPLFHIYGMTTSMTAPISLASKMVLLPKFEPTNACKVIQEQNVTVFCGVPTMYSLMLSDSNLGNFDLKSIRVCVSGASPLPLKTQKVFMEITGALLVEGYGLTEASPVTHCNPIGERVKSLRNGSIGFPLLDTEAKIVDLEIGTKALGVGQIGELAVKGPQVMKGYWNNPGETAQVLRDGWLLTGDIARVDNEGYFYITDRKKDLIKYKSYSVSPFELEEILYEHSAVKLCAVVGEQDTLAGEIPVAFVVLKDGAEVTGGELEAFANSKVAPYKAIRKVEFRKDLPVSPTGKVLKRQLTKCRK